MKTYMMLEVAVEVAWQVGDILENSPRAESRWLVADIAQDIINKGLVSDTTEDLDEVISAYLVDIGRRELTKKSFFYVICTMESGQTVTWEDSADDINHAEGLAIAYAEEQTGEQVYSTYIETSNERIKDE